MSTLPNRPRRRSRGPTETEESKVGGLFRVPASSAECRRSGPSSAFGSAKTVAASSNETRCLTAFAAAFFVSHSNTYLVYTQLLDSCAPLVVWSLRPFGIHPMKLRFGERTANGYTKRMFLDPWSRYLPGQSGTAEQHQ